ncbi:MAG: TetR/AcrR family transcriptional regulator [Anaerolineae bacterium]|nr:TetR/AcrR family transcriptional regulator [Anaerolineae bacterium]
MTKTQKQIQSEQTQQKIIEAATQLFVRKGFYGTSISDLAQATSLTKGALYHHFENKNAIFFAVIQTVRNTWHNEVARDVLKAKTAPSRLTALLDNHARLHKNNETICLVLNGLMMEMEGMNPEFMLALQEIYNELAQFIEHIIQKGQQAGEIKPDLDSRLVSLNIVGILRAIGCSGIFNHMDVEYEAMTETLKQMLLDGLRP